VPTTERSTIAALGPLAAESRRCRLAVPSAPRIGGEVFRYRLHSPDGDDLGEATYAMMIKPGEEVHGSGGERLRVLDVVPFAEEDESPFVGMLKVEARQSGV
jgi:hypothetical protein